MFDAVIAGAGPNGLMLACELALAGTRPLIVEKLPTPSLEQRANGMAGQTVRILHRRGLLERLTGDPRPPDPAPQFLFAGFPLPLHQLSDNPFYGILAPQPKLEAMLAERASELGVEIRRGREITGFTPKDDRVVIEIAGEEQIEAQFLVGADGGKSTIRKLAGIGFPGVTKDDSVSRIFDVIVPDELQDSRSGGLDIPGYGIVPPFLHHRTERGLVSYAPFPDGRRMIAVSTRARPVVAEEFTFDEFREALDYVIGAPVPVAMAIPGHPRRLTGGNTRIADHYRSDRVLLVGDAAHVHSAIGGPGLNLGLQDAINLGWKLAATIQGRAPEGLLDTYETERRPAAERVTMHTQAQHVLIGPGPEVTALRTLFGELLEEPAVLSRIARLISGADLRHDVGDSHPLAGYLSPDLDPAATRTGRTLLNDPTGRLASTVAPWRERVEVIGNRQEASMLVRPDGYVAWASDEDKPDAEALRNALERWLGRP